MFERRRLKRVLKEAVSACLERAAETVPFQILTPSKLIGETASGDTSCGIDGRSGTIGRFAPSN
jgi:hypothetical protein